jgi:hypothetical protein
MDKYNTDINDYDSEDDHINKESENLFQIEKLEMENDQHILNMYEIIQNFIKETPSFILDKMRLKHFNELIDANNLTYQPQADT